MGQGRRKEDLISVPKRFSQAAWRVGAQLCAKYLLPCCSTCQQACGGFQAVRCNDGAHTRPLNLSFRDPETRSKVLVAGVCDCGGLSGPCPTGVRSGKSLCRRDSSCLGHYGHGGLTCNRSDAWQSALRHGMRRWSTNPRTGKPYTYAENSFIAGLCNTTMSSCDDVRRFGLCHAGKIWRYELCCQTCSTSKHELRRLVSHTQRVAPPASKRPHCDDPLARWRGPVRPLGLLLRLRTRITTWYVYCAETGALISYQDDHNIMLLLTLAGRATVSTTARR